MINPATVLLISKIDFNGPTIAPTAVIGVLRISPKKITPNKIEKGVTQKYWFYINHIYKVTPV